jgi:hypothetical protein
VDSECSSGSSDTVSAPAQRLIESEQLDAALAALGSRFTPGYMARMSTLDVAICAFVDGLRGDHISAAQMLIVFKTHLAAFPTSSVDRDVIAVRRSIARYYEGQREELA